MKRLAKVSRGVVKHYSFFRWCKCNKCKREFRREHGYKYEIGYSIIIYLCSTCASDIETAYKYLTEKDWLPQKPEAPPAMDKKNG